MRGMNGIVGLGELLGPLGTPVGFYEEWVPSHVRTTCTPKGISCAASTSPCDITCAISGHPQARAGNNHHQLTAQLPLIVI